MTFAGGASEVTGALCAVHPDRPASFVCTRCGTYGCPGCVFGAMAEHVICHACARGGLAEPLPWERRRELGLWSAFWQTTRLVLLEPTATFRTPQTEPGIGGPILYAVLAYTAGQVIVLTLVMLAMVVMGAVVAGVTEEPALGAFFAGYGLCLVPITLLQVPVYAIVGLLVSSGLSHLTLVLSGKSTASFEQTLRAIGLANAPHLFELISCLSYPWVVVAETIALREVHRCSTGVALFATVGWRILLFGGLLAVYAVFVAAMIAAAPR